MDFGISLLRLLGALVVVLGVFFVGVWFFQSRYYRRFTAWWPSARTRDRQPSLSVLEVKPLGNRQALYLVRCEQHRLLIGSSPAGLTPMFLLPEGNEIVEPQIDTDEHGYAPAVKSRVLATVVLALALFIGDAACAQETNSPDFQLSSLTSPLSTLSQSNTPIFRLPDSPADVDVGIKVLFAITLLTLAPSILLLMTCFTRIVIVLSFVRTALSLQGTPANQVIIGLSLFITLFVMAPVWERINRDALSPYQAKQISSEQALANASDHIRTFMLKQARPKDVELFLSMSKMGPTTPDQLPLKVVIPGFILSELRTAFQMGFLLFVPFILIDLVVATVLMSLGMMMMPPMTIALPLKLLLFVLVDGWSLVVRSLMQSFGF